MVRRAALVVAGVLLVTSCGSTAGTDERSVSAPPVPVETAATLAPTLRTAAPVAPSAPATNVPCVALPSSVCGQGDLIRYSTARGTFTYVGFHLEPGTPVYAPYPVRVAFTWARYPECAARVVQGTVVGIGPDDISLSYNFIGDLQLTVDTTRPFPLAVGDRFASIAATGAKSFGNYNLALSVTRLSQGEATTAEDILQGLFPQAYARASAKEFAETADSRSCPPAITNPQYFGGTASPRPSGAP